MISPHPPLWSYLALAASMSLVGSYVALSKMLLVVFPVFVLAWWRFLIAAAAMAHWLRRPTDCRPMSGGDHARLFAQSFFGNFLFSICMLYGVGVTTASEAGVIMSTLPAMVAMFSALVLRERIRAWALAGIVLTVVGLALYALGKPAVTTESEWWGKALIFAAVCCEALYVVIGKSLSARIDARRVSAVINLWGLALMSPLALLSWPQWSTQAVSAGLWTLLLFYSLAASVWTVWLWMKGLRHIDAHRAGVFTVMLPISAAAIGVAFLGERLSAIQVLAFALALLGVGLTQMSHWRLGHVASGAALTEAAPLRRMDRP